MADAAGTGAATAGLAAGRPVETGGAGGTLGGTGRNSGPVWPQPASAAAPSTAAARPRLETAE